MFQVVWLIEVAKKEKNQYAKEKSKLIRQENSWCDYFNSH